jgi:hypothetical protein
MRLDDGHGFLCGTCLDLTLYLSDAPDGALALRALDVYRRIAPAGAFRYLAGEDGEWSDISACPQARDVRPLLSRMDARIDAGLWLWDGDEDGWSFLIRGVPPMDVAPFDEDDEDDDDGEEAGLDDPSGLHDRYNEDVPAAGIRQVECASLCRVQMPEDTDPACLSAMARELAKILPVLSGHGGLACNYDPWRKYQAFDVIFGWAKRYIGLDVHDLTHTLPLMRDSAKCAGWLTLIGEPLWSTLLAARGGAAPRFSEGVTLETHADIALMVAGDAPTPGDRNRQMFPTHYAAVDRELKPILLSNHPPFPGPFEEQDNMRDWLERFSSPSRW